MTRIPIGAVLGFLVGIAGFGTLWWNSVTVQRDLPVFALPMFALSPTVIRYGDALRGYGLGLATMFMMIGAVSSLIWRPTRFRILFGLIASLLAVHSMYFNTVVLLTLGAGGAVVSLRRRDYRPVAAVVSIGLLAALSLLAYLDPLARQYKWNAIIKYRVNFAFIMSKVSGALLNLG